VLVLSQYVEAEYATGLLSEQTEGTGYLLKDRVAKVDDFTDAVRRVAGGGSALDPAVVAQLVGRRRVDDPLADLTAREREVLELMAEGLSNHGIAARRLGTRARPHAYACGHLANSASLLLPVSNLTNLLAFTVSGLSFGRFAALMALPWLVSIGVDYVAISRSFGGDLKQQPVLDDGRGSGDLGLGTAAEAADTPVFALVVVCLTLGGFVVASAAGANPAWAALGGALLLAVRGLRRRETTVAAIARSADLPFLVFVIALGVVVVAVVDNGLGSALRPVIVSGSSLPALLAVAALAAVLASAVNNLPAVLVLLPLTAASGAGAVLAVLIGVNLGPNLTYTGSLATLLWRRVLRASGTDASLGEFTRLGVLSVVPALVLSVLFLWLSLHV